jgi:hypothetical protein
MLRLNKLLMTTALFSLTAQCSIGQNAVTTHSQPKQGVSASANKEKDAPSDKELPCPLGRNLTEEVKYGEYAIRTYRYPDPEGCLRISKGGKLVFSSSGGQFQIGKNFFRDPGIPVGTDLTGREFRMRS